MLARRELSVEGVRARLLQRGHPPDTIDAAVAHLLETGALDDARVARAYARTAVTVKGRGRLRIMRELHAMGVEKQIAAEALGEVFGDLDERTLIARALQKKLRGRPRPAGAAEFARLYRYLLRQGFTPSAVAEALRRFRGSASDDV